MREMAPAPPDQAPHPPPPPTSRRGQEAVNETGYESGEWKKTCSAHGSTGELVGCFLLGVFRSQASCFPAAAVCL